MKKLLDNLDGPLFAHVLTLYRMAPVGAVVDFLDLIDPEEGEDFVNMRDFFERYGLIVPNPDGLGYVLGAPSREFLAQIQSLENRQQLVEVIIHRNQKGQERRN